LALYTKRKEKREIIRERKPREEIITITRPTNRTGGERKRGREEEHREEGTKRPALSTHNSNLQSVQQSQV
jgi:hypothetical protein